MSTSPTPLADLVADLNGFLNVDEIKDYPNAVNGLQVENAGAVTKVAVAVDACESVIQSAVQGGADLLIVHHGLFWGGLTPLTGAAYRKIKLCLDHGLAVYSAHLPLDAHREVGNNILLAEALGCEGEAEAFLDIGWAFDVKINREVLHSRIEHAVGRAVHFAPGGPIESRRVGIVTGGAGGEIFRAKAAGVDTFITGEGPHWSYTAAEEAGVNLFYAGHYATETFGVKALGEYLEEKYALPWTFIDHPTGL